MGVVIYILIVTLFIVEFITGNVGNGFIALVNFMDWVKKRKISAVDQILTALAISRLELLWSLFIMVSTISFYPDLWTTVRTVRVTNVMWIVSNQLSIWLSTSLSVFYFLKIASFSSSIFLYLKWRIKKMVSLALMMFLLLSFSDILVTNTHINIWMDEFKTNSSYSYRLNRFRCFVRFIVLTNIMFTLVPFAVSLSTFFLLIFSLWSHLKKMRCNAQGLRDASSAAHVTALYTVVVFLLLYTIFFLSLVSQFLGYEFQEKTIFRFLCPVGIFAFPSIHSWVLILGNRKLRRASLLVLQWLKLRIQ